MPTELTSEIVGGREKFLIYGLSGVGKTYASGTMPGPIYDLCVGGPNELKTLMAPAFRERYSDQKIYFDFVRENRGPQGKFETAEAFDIAGDLLDEAFELDRKGDMPFESLVLDNSTSFSDIAMNKSIQINASFSRGGKTALGKLRDEGVLVPSDADWGSEMSLMKKLITWCWEQDKHFCLIAHEWVTSTTDRSTHTSTVTSRRPLFIGKNREWIPNLFDNVWYFEAVGGKKSRRYEALTQGDAITMAKTRMGGVLDVRERDVNFMEIIQRFKEAS